MSPQDNAPPPPPPPPPLEVGNGNGGIVQQIVQRISTEKPIANGDIPSNTSIMPNAQAANGVLISGAQHMVGPKKILPPFHDSRTDLMKAIRDGEYFNINFFHQFLSYLYIQTVQIQKQFKYIWQNQCT